METYPKSLIAVCCLAVIALAGGIFVTRMTPRWDTEHLCEKWAKIVLTNAKTGFLEEGTYEAALPVSDF